MEKLSITISPEDWGNLITKYNADSKKVSLADFTDGTINVDTDVTGSLTKREGGVNYNPVALPASPKDQFEAIFSDGARHLLVVANGEIRYSSGDNAFNTVVNGTGFSALANFEFATTQDRVYGGNAVNNPIVYDRNTTYGGVVYTAPRTKLMGAQAPIAAPTAPGAGAAGGAVPAGAHTYKVTYLYYDFQESNGSPASGVCTVVAPNQTVNLTAIPIGGYGVTARKIYRDNNDGLYLHVGTITDNTTTIFSDTLAVGVTPTEIPEFNNAPPSFGLITSWLDKLWLGKVPGDPSTLFYTETGLPDIVRPENQLLCNQEDPITAYIVYFNRLIVFNRRSMGQILGTTPDTFRYAAIPSSIGCVDNRTLQIRVIEGVPILIWLSDRGFYSYNGNAINYISDEIEDLVNFNIQQAIQQKNLNTQSSQAQFLSGVSSNGIDLVSNPGAITTRGYLEGTSIPGTNPRRNFDDQSDWESGNPTANLALRGGDNLLKAINTINPSLGAGGGTLTGDMFFGLTPRLSTSADHTGGSNTGGTAQASTATYSLAAQPVVIPRAGTVTSITVGIGASIPSDPSAQKYRLRVWRDAGGNPGTDAYVGPVGTQASVGVVLKTEAVSIACSTGETIWIGMERVTPAPTFDCNFGVTASTTFSGIAKMFLSGSWQNINPAPFGATANHGQVAYVFNATPIAKNGTWTSPIFDTQSITATTVSVSTAFFNVSTFGTKTTNFIVEASNDGVGFSQILLAASRFGNTYPIALSGQRYFRFKLTMATTDDRESDAFTGLSAVFPDGVEWISPTIDTTADVTAYNSLTTTQTLNGGTVVYTVATSADDISYTPYVAIGSATLQRYIKIKATITKSGGVSPTISSIILRWTIVSNLVSSGIDTGVTPPAGWDIFLSSFNTNGGTVVFQMRSAATLGGLTAATFFTVTPGEFPTDVTPLQFVQWKVIITSSDNDVPVVDSVTIQWFIGLVDSIRPASIFVDSRYYIALAELNQATNNVLLELDSDGKWRRHAGLNISTFSFFFNRPYFGLSTTGTIRKFLEGLTDAGTPIEFDVRFKASDYSTQYQNHASKVKVVGEVILRGINTGATFQLFYSVDMGETFIPMLTSSGTSSYVSAADGQNFYVRFRPTWDGSNPISGRTIMYRIYNNDAFAVEINGLEATAFLRNQAPVVTG